MISVLAIAGYRSLRDLRLQIGPLSVITGENGTGKSNIYRALHLLADAADGGLGHALAREGGMPSALWAGPGVPRKRDAGVRLSVGFSDEVTAYELRLGLPNIDPSQTLFPFDPEVKEETIRLVENKRIRLLERRGQSVMLRDDAGQAQIFPAQIDLSESILSQLAEPHRYPVLSTMRERIRRWRFYHQFRTDLDSPVRIPHVGTRTPVLAHNGSNLAAALQTILENGNDRALNDAVEEAFDGARVEVTRDEARFRLGLLVPGLARPLDASELSDGTLRYLGLLAALKSPRPPELLVLNEPETSLHPRVLTPLAKQIVDAANRSQVIVVSHAAHLVDAIAGARTATRIELTKINGQTSVAHRGRLDAPTWTWSD